MPSTTSAPTAHRCLTTSLVGGSPTTAPSTTRPSRPTQETGSTADVYLFADRVLDLANRESWLGRLSAAIVRPELTLAPTACLVGVVAGFSADAWLQMASVMAGVYGAGAAVHVGAALHRATSTGTREVVEKELEPLLERFPSWPASDRALAAATVATWLPALNERREIAPEATVRLRELVRSVPAEALAPALRALAVLSELRLDPDAPSLGRVRIALAALPEEERSKTEQLARATLLGSTDRSWHGLRREERRRMADALFPAPGTASGEVLVAELSLLDAVARRNEGTIAEPDLQQIGQRLGALGLDEQRSFRVRTKEMKIREPIVRDVFAHADR